MQTRMTQKAEQGISMVTFCDIILLHLLVDLTQIKQLKTYIINNIKAFIYLSMYLSQGNPNPLQSQEPSNDSPFTHVRISVQRLQEYLVNSYYSLCSLPPLDELFENLQTIDNHEKVQLKLHKCRVQNFVKKFCNQDDEEESNYIFYAFSGKFFLLKNKDLTDSNPSSATPERKSLEKRRKSSIFMSGITNSQGDASNHDRTKSNSFMRPGVQAKQNCFFSLVSYKKLNDHEKYTLIGIQNPELSETNDNNQCLYGYLKINPKYNAKWYVEESKKYLFLSKIFRKGRQQISETKLKGLCRFFKHQQYRRGLSFVRQNQLNDRFMILHQGQCQYTKTFTSVIQSQLSRSIRIANAGPESIFGVEFLLYEFSGFSKQVSVATQALIEKYYHEPIMLEAKQLNQLESHDSRNLKSHKKSRSKANLDMALQKSDKEAQKNEQQYSQINLPLHRSSYNNFQVTVISAYAQFYYIPIEKLKQLCTKYVQELPFNLRNYIENSYITLLRMLKEKIQIEIIKINRNVLKTNQERIMFQTRMKSGQYGKKPQMLINMTDQDKKLNKIDDQGPQYQENQVKIKINKSELINTHLKNPVTDMSRNKRLQKKIEFALRDKKEVGNFKKKIQVLLKEKLLSPKKIQSFLDQQTLGTPKNKSDIYNAQKLSPQRLTKSPELSKTPSPNELREKKKLIMDLQQIFMNNDDNMRSQSIGRQHQILSKKQNLLKKRYSLNDNLLIVNQQCYDTKKNKMFRMDLLRKGVKMTSDKQLGQGDKNSSNKNEYRRSLDMNAYSNHIKTKYTQKINKANKIKQQFMTIRSQCQTCHCYDEIENSTSTRFYKKDFKQQAMKTGSAWRLSANNFYEDKKQQPLEKLHSRTKFISEKSASKYHHNQHLKNKRKGLVSSLDKHKDLRRLSAPNFATID